MKSSTVAVIALIACAGVLGIIAFLMHGHAGLLAPQGTIAEEELVLIGNVVSLMAIVMVAVFSLAFFFAWWYRASNKEALYSPNWEHGALSELVWWAIPVEIVLVLGAVTWTSTHDLDPHKALRAGTPPLTIEVVALPWKWLFIYPDQGIATVNDVRFPAGTPVRFTITADAPMNSFWIPELGGQIYAMTGMSTELNLVAGHAGTYTGSSANYSGIGFATMTFTARSLSKADFDTWVQSTRLSKESLTLQAYDALSKPSAVTTVAAYGSIAPHLYDSILMKFMPASPQPSQGGPELNAGDMLHRH